MTCTCRKGALCELCLERARIGRLADDFLRDRLEVLVHSWRVPSPDAPAPFVPYAHLLSPPLGLRLLSPPPFDWQRDGLA
mgnify:CR=1 FL=1